MRAYQDSLTLEQDFPFRIDEFTLGAAEDGDERFHWHSFLEITRILEGTGLYCVNGHSFQVGPGDILLFNSDELHGWQVLERELRVLAMVFSAELVTGSGGFSDMEYLRPFIERGGGFLSRIGADERYAQDIAATMEEIRGEWQARSPGYTLMIKADVLRILTLLVRHYDDGAADGSGDRSKALRRLRPAFEYIDESFCGRVTLREAAERVYMSPNYFSHYFHAATDISFSDYVSLRRIRKARRLLETTGKSIYEIAMECGFSNSSNFYRLYKKHIGESPRKRRRPARR